MQYELIYRQLEQSLELMKEEFESMESYWQGKMDHERRFYEDQIRTGEEQFKELEDRLKEYIGLLEPENERMIDGVGALYTIDETCSMESQVFMNYHFQDLLSNYWTSGHRVGRRNLTVKVYK